MNTHSRNTWGIALACFLGAFIGALISLEIAARFEFGKILWPLGALLGGVIGWVACDPAELRKELVKNTLKKIKDCQLKVKSWFVGQLEKTQLRSAVSAIYAVILIASWFLPMYYVCVFNLNMGLDNNYQTNNHWSLAEKQFVDLFRLLFPAVLLSSITYAACLLISGCAAILIDNLCRFNLKAWHPLHEGSRTNYPGGFLLITNSLVMLPCALIGVFMIALALALEALWTLSQIAKDTFIKVHSQKRLICLVDSAIGAAVGYYCGSAVLGGLAGSVAGVINYELVSVRWLKLVPRS